MVKEYDVTLIGLGPVGSLAALLLNHYGLKVLAIDKEEKIYDLPRAVTISDQGLRIMQSLDLENIYLDNSSEVEGAGFVDKELKEIGGSMDFKGFITSNAWPPMRFFHQPYTDNAIRGALLSSNVTTLLEHELLQIKNKEKSVEVAIKNLNQNKIININSKYLIGSDGGSSKVRKLLEINQEDLNYNRDWIVVDVKLKGKNKLHNKAIQICDPKRLATYIPAHLPFRRWEFLILEGEDKYEISKESKIQEFIKPWLKPSEYEIIRTAVYQFHSVLANNFRKGNCFLMGDAAHQNPPFMGEGMNTGYRDAANLSWKIALTLLKNITSTNLLDTYEKERKPHSKFIVENSSRIGKLMEAYAKADNPDDVPQELVSSGYGSFITPNLEEGLFFKGKADDSMGAGQLFPQPTEVEESAIVKRLDILFGKGFSIVSKKKIFITDEDKKFLETLDTTFVLLKDKLIEQNPWLVSFMDYGEIFILRPDKYVFGCTSDTVTLEDLINDLRVRIGD